MSKEVDRDREERRLCKKYNILFRGPAHPWPKDHTRAFQHVSVLGKYFFSDYAAQNDGLETGEKRWKSSTIGRAKRLVETASRLQGTQPSELKWRLDLEKIIYGRFELEIECPEPRCRGRLWRSEIEVVSEIEESIIGKSISERQQARVPCQCNAEAVLKNHNNIPLNQVFADRVDNFVIHGGEAASELRPRKPDRVYGLQQTKCFQGVLGDIVRVIENQTEKKIDITPFDDSTDPIIFPFLISEAKSEKGDSFEACERQSAFPIWKLLCLQEGLEKESKRPLVEQGGPLVWFLANRGEDWRVYGCYVKSQTEIDRTSYNIHNLWSGRVDSLDGALQLLLIMDYIFDWARDLYRAGIYRQLQSLTAENFSETRSIASDSDIYSLRPLDGKSSKSVPVHLSSHHIIDFGEGNIARPLVSWDPQANKSFRAVEPQLSGSDREQAMPMPDLMQWKNFDQDHGVFRPGNLITNSFECVHVTTSNLDLVLWSLAKMKPKDAARTLYNLFYFHPFLVSERFLDSLETAWTGTERRSPHTPNLEPQKTIVALFTYRVRFSRDWILTRYLTCLAFDAAAFALTSVLSGYKSQPSSGVFHSERISETEIQKLSICLQADSPIDYFVHAMNQKTKTIVKLKDPTQDFDLVSSVNSLKVIDAVGKIWRSDLGSNPFGFADTDRRFSTKSFTLSGQKLSPRSSSSLGPELLSACQIVLKENRSILFHSEPCEGGVWRRKYPVPPFCLFVLGTSPEAPDRRSQIDLLHDVIRNGKVFFTCHETNNPYSSALRKEEYEVVNNDQILWKMALLWYRSVLSSWKWQQPEYKGKGQLEDFGIDPIHGLPIIDLEDPEFLALREQTDAMMELGSSDEESDETSISFVKQEPRSRRESLDVVIPESDKGIWKRLKRHFV